jgi:hypothetical protein
MLRIAPFQVLGINGIVVARVLRNADVVTLNDRSKYAYQFSSEDIARIQ